MQNVKKIYTDKIFKGKILPQKHVNFNSRQMATKHCNRNRTLGNCMDNITLGKYTLVTFTLGKLALSLGNHTPGTHVLQQK